MKTYIKFLIVLFFKTFLNTFSIIFSLVFIINLLTEVDFFKNSQVDYLFPVYLAVLNSPNLINELFPFIFLISTQFFFIKLFKDDQILIFKYSGLKNINIINIICIFSFFIGIFIIIFFYNISSNLKNIYLSLKSNYTDDKTYLAVITKNGLWIKDKIGSKTYIINSSKIENNFLVDVFITEFDENYKVLRNIISNKVDIEKTLWIVRNAKVYDNNNYIDYEIINIQTNFDYKKIESLFSELSSLSLLKLLNLKKNYKSLNYSTTELDLHILKILSYPIFFLLMTIISSIIMFNTKNIKNNIFKISIGLFASVVIFYINNFFFVLGATERISMFLSILLPLLFLTTLNTIMIYKINEQ